MLSVPLLLLVSSHNFTVLKFKNIARTHSNPPKSSLPLIDVSLSTYLNKYKLKPLVVKVLFKSIHTEYRVLLLPAMRFRTVKRSCGEMQHGHSYEWSLQLETVVINTFTVTRRQMPPRKSPRSLHVPQKLLSGSFVFLSKAFSETSCVSWIWLLNETPLTSNYHPHRFADRAVHLRTSKHFQLMV